MSSCTSRGGAGIVTGVLACFLLSAAVVGSGAVAGTAQASEGRPYSRVATTRCLTAKGARVGPVRRDDSRLLAFAQLAQKNSILVRFQRGWVAVAFEESRIDARSLREALRLPNDPYRLEITGTVVLMSPKSASATRRAVLACLR